MSRLQKGIFGTEFRPVQALFSLCCGQMRGSKYRVAKNSGWYNKAGEKLGWGDLDANDVRKISQELEPDEIFIVLREGDSFWNFVERPGLLGSNALTKPEVDAPGIDYVAMKCCYIIAKDHQLYVDEIGSHSDGDVTNHYGAEFKVMSREMAKHFLATVRGPDQPTI